MRKRIIELLSDALPAVNLESDFLFEELDSLSVVTIMMILGDEYKIRFDATDATPRNFRSVDALVKMVENKLAEKQI